jgi:cysteinyl-tRNA synthetase
MLVAAGLEGRSSREIADAYEAAFHADAALVNLLPAHEFPRATEHIPEMLALAERLEDLGHAYLTPAGNLYYEVATYPGYGALSGNTLDELRGGHRGELEPDKRDHPDFALWKAAGEGRELRWDSRWGEGFPGWHLECSAMALKHLGERFDVHTGGEDNVFPHHEDEIAQSAPIVGGPPANAWVHGAHLLMSGLKMSKSAGNFLRITEVAAEGIDPLAFRYLCLTARYARKLNLSDASLAGAAGGLGSLRAELAGLGPAPDEGPWAAPPALRAGRSADRPNGRMAGIAGHGAADEGGWRSLDARGSAAAPSTEPPLADRAHTPPAPLSEEGRRLHEAFVAAVDDDLDMPGGLRVAREALRADLPADERRWLVLDMDIVLGLDLDLAIQGAAVATAERKASAELSNDARGLLDARREARARRDFAAADELRDRRRELRIEPIDNPDGSSDWRRLD